MSSLTLANSDSASWCIRLHPLLPRVSSYQESDHDLVQMARSLRIYTERVLRLNLSHLRAWQGADQGRRVGVRLTANKVGWPTKNKQRWNSVCVCVEAASPTMDLICSRVCYVYTTYMSEFKVHYNGYFM